MNRFEPFNDCELELIYSTLAWQYSYSSMEGRDEIKNLAQEIFTEQLERKDHGNNGK